MSCWLLTLALMAVAPRATSVTVGIFSLFQPRQVSVRVASGHEASVEATDSQTDGHYLKLRAGETLRVELSGQALAVLVTDRYGTPARSLSASRVSVIPSPVGTLEVRVPRGPSRLAKGCLGVGLTAAGVLAISVTTDLESAVASVVNAEMGEVIRPEALKALAVAARSYMLAHRGRHLSEGFDYCDTTHCQFFAGAIDLASGAREARVFRAVSETKNQCILFQGNIVEGHYSASCGGLSATPEMVWGGRTASGYPYRRIACRWCRQSLHWRWVRSAGVASVLASLAPSIGFTPKSSAELQVETAPGVSFVSAVVVGDAGRTAKMTGDRFRRAIGRSIGWNIVLSPTFTVKRRGSTFVFSGRGFGSQAGLCLAGAVAQAAAGRDYRSILEYYYPGCTAGLAL